MDYSTPGFPVHHQLPELTQTHVHWVSDAIQPSHPLWFPSPSFNLSQHQGFFPWSPFFASGDQSIGVSTSKSVLPMNIRDWFPFLSQSVIIRNILNLVFINYTSDFSAFYWTKLLFIFEFLWPITLSVKSHLLILTYVNTLLKFCPNYKVLNLNSKLYD